MARAGPPSTSLKIGYLSAMDIFRDLRPEEVAEIGRNTRMLKCQKGTVFYSPQEKGEVLFLLKEGKVEVYQLSSGGRKLAVATLGPGTFFGEMALLGQGMSNAFAEASEDCLVCIISRPELEALLHRHPAVALRLLEALGQRTRGLEDRLEDMAFKHLPARLAHHLLGLAQERGREIEGVSHRELAERLGTYRETATQILDNFKAAGLIGIERKKITLLDEERLREIAEG